VQCEPNQFDSSDACKLHAFLVQLEFTFNDHPKVFRKGSTKVNYALSFLKGTALEWFEPGIVLRGSPVEPGWLTNWHSFTYELRTNFGPHDPVREAESEMERLHQREGDHITKYNVAFFRLSAQLHWGNAALRHTYYCRLPACTKDDIACVGKPDNLVRLCNLATTINGRYWERHSEIFCERSSKPSNNNNNASRPCSDQQNKNASASSSSQKPHDQRSDNTHSRPANSARPNNTATPTSRNPELQGKLGKDGKLTAEERQRRFDNKLCMFCSGTGHIAKDCNKRNKDAKARSSNIKTTDPTTVAGSSDSKK
jgi:hypothetical protein